MPERSNNSLRLIVKVDDCMVSAVESTEGLMPFSNHRRVVGAGEQSCVLVDIQQRLAMNASLYLRKRANCPQSGADGTVIILSMRIRARYIRPLLCFF